MEYDFQRCTRRCAVTGRELAPGETYYSALVEAGRALRRVDYSAEAWAGPPEGAIGWWRSHLPRVDRDRPQPPPSDRLLQVFEELQGQPDRADFCYLLALLLVRRRLLRLDEEQRDASGREILVLYCPRRDTTYRVPAVPPDPSRAGILQEELGRLLAGSPPQTSPPACQGIA